MAEKLIDPSFSQRSRTRGMFWRLLFDEDDDKSRRASNGWPCEGLDDEARQKPSGDVLGIGCCGIKAMEQQGS